MISIDLMQLSEALIRNFHQAGRIYNVHSWRYMKGSCLNANIYSTFLPKLSWKVHNTVLNYSAILVNENKLEFKLEKFRNMRNFSSYCLHLSCGPSFAISRKDAQNGCAKRT